MQKINARSLLSKTTTELWEILTGQFILVMDDGELLTDHRQTLYSSYAWDFHRKYPLTPLLLRHHVTTLLEGKRMGSDTHLELLGEVMWGVYDAYNALPGQEIDRDPLAEMVYRITNVMYNDLSYRCEAYVVSLDMTDFTEAMNHPRVRHANDTAQPNQRSIDETYGEIKDVLTNGIDLPTNRLSLAARSKLGNVNQILQCISVRGYLTDIDSNVFRNPVMRGFAMGLRSLHDSVVESRSASKSLIFSKSPLQQAEYFSRRLQLMSQTVCRLHRVDCGTTEYLHWTMRGPVRKGSQLIHGGDLKQHKGKYYMDDDGALKVIRGDDRHLIGRTLKLRSVLHCAHSDAYGLCATCFGELSESVPDDTNIGHMCCTSMTQKSSQNVLSVKHLDGSSVVEGITLGADDRKYLRIGVDENSYLLSETIKGMDVKLVIPESRTANITDIVEAQNIDDLNITRISELEEIGLVVNDGQKEQKPSLYVHIGRRLASMTFPLLKYIREHGWQVDANGNYVIDMKHWDWNKPILLLPLKHINMSDHSRDIAELLESSVDELQLRDKGISPDAVLVQLYDLVNDKLSVNLAVLEVILYATMIVSAEKMDYGLPKPWTERGLGVMSMTMARRSASAAMAYEGHREYITSPLSYIFPNVPDHPMDGILMPAEVFGHEYQ
jgi:hypothetical protein